MDSKKEMADSNYGAWLRVVVIVGVLLRLSLWAGNPIQNSYDDHLSAIQIYSEMTSRPSPGQCWQCYQPPAYHVVSAIIYNLTEAITNNNRISWKAVQGLNTALSVILLMVFYSFLKRRVNNVWGIIVMAFVSFLPRDIMSSAMITNDYLLVFSSFMSSIFLFRFWLGHEKRARDYIILCLFCVLGALTKQHGMILLILPLVSLYQVFDRSWKERITFSLIAFICIFIGIGDELWKMSETGRFLVSNQDFFPLDSPQFPASLDKVEFLSFRIIGLWTDVYLSSASAASVPTQLFSRLFFDYEWRFLSPSVQDSLWVGRGLYIVGLSWVLVFTRILFKRRKWLFNAWRSRVNSRILIVLLACVVLSFLSVPIIQTLRFPYFSSMKAVFILPGLSFCLVWLAILGKREKVNPIYLSLPVVSLLLALIFVVLSVQYLNGPNPSLSGPMWEIP